MEHPPLIVMTAVPASAADCSLLLRRMRRVTYRSTCPVLLICDLPDARTPKAAGDEALLRALQSGVMSMARSAPGQYMLLVRSRVFDDAQRMYLGASQPVPPGQTAAQLITQGRCGARFDAATVSPASLLRRSDSVLLLRRHVICTPDAPARMLDALHASDDGCLCARAALPDTDDAPILNRLLRGGFSFCALRSARACMLQASGMADPKDSPALLLSRAALEALACGSLPSRCPAVGFPFLLYPAPSADALLARFRRECAAALRPSCADVSARLDALLPLLRLLLLLIAALDGRPALAAAAVLLPEAASLLHPCLLPGALVRLSLLPACAYASLDALLRSLLARSPRLRIELPFCAGSGPLCAAFGALLFASALQGRQALAALTAVSLLFAAAPLLLRALASPARERIPLTPQEQALLLADAKSAFLGAAQDDIAPPRRMLADCAGCTLGLLEPDEAARRIQDRLSETPPAPLSTADAACMLTAAQYLREHMGDCDASLRALPAQIEQRVLCGGVIPNASPLSSLLRRAVREAPFDSPDAGTEDPIEALFLPRLSACPLGALLLPLRAPHTYLLRREQSAAAPQISAEHALVLAEAALGRPFLALFLRSPAAGAYAPLLLCRQTDVRA